jgi:hypothetical protein
MGAADHKRRPGTFVLLAHDLYRHPKVLALAHDGHHRSILAQVLALSWCGDNRTDGWVPDYALTAIMARRSDAEQLVAVGLWERDTGGWWIHGWLEWQDTNRDRESRTERMRALANLRHHGHPDGPGPNVTDLHTRRDA